MGTTIVKILESAGKCIGGVGAKLRLVFRENTIDALAKAMETRAGRQPNGTTGGSWLHVQQDNGSILTIHKDSDVRVELITPGNGELLPNMNPYWATRRRNQKSGQVFREFAKDAVQETNRNTQIAVQKTFQEHMARFQSQQDAQWAQMFEQVGTEFRKVMTVSVHTSRKVDELTTALKALAKELGLSDQDMDRIVEQYRKAS
jgi:hypothetical protein